MVKYPKYISTTWRLLLAYTVLYVLLLFLDLHLIPVVWFDEVLSLDPAVNFIFKSGLQSYMWPQEGTEVRFMAYLPIQTWLHIAHLYLFPFKVYSLRLPWIIYGLVAFFIFFKAFRAAGINRLLSLVILIFIINDRVVFETLRAMRIEPVSYLFLAILMLAYYLNKTYLQAFIACLLTLTHPNLWFIALVFFIHAIWRKRKSVIKDKLILWSFPLLTLLLLLFFIQFDWNLFYQQLTEHVSHHSAKGGGLQKLGDHFYFRFWPYYMRQPWTIVVIYLALFTALYDLIKGEINPVNIALLGTHIYWFVVLAPFYRYNGVLLILSLYTLVPYIRNIRFQGTLQWKTALLIFVVLLSPVEVLGRHILAGIQKNERQPEPVINWLHKSISGNNNLVFGHDIAYYAVARSEKNAYMLFNVSTHKFSFENYNNHYFIADSKWELPGLEEISSYHATSSRLSEKLDNYIQVKTYRELFLYRVEDIHTYKRVLKDLNENNKTRASAYRAENF